MATTTTGEEINNWVGYASEVKPGLKATGLGTLSAIIEKYFNPDPSLKDSTINVVQDAAIGGASYAAKDYLTQRALARTYAQYAINQGLLNPNVIKTNWFNVARAGLKGAGVVGAATAALEGGYALGRAADEAWDVSGYWARKLAPSYDPSDTSYRNTKEYQEALQAILENRKRREEADRLKREKVFNK